jgi:hypothetical protein
VTIQRCVGRGFDASNFYFSLPVIFGIVAHRVLYLLGVCSLDITLVGIIKLYNKLPNFKEHFFFENRSI